MTKKNLSRWLITFEAGILRNLARFKTHSQTNPLQRHKLNTWQNFAWPRIQTSTVSAGWTMLLATVVRMGASDDPWLPLRCNRDSAHHQTEVIPWRIPKQVASAFAQSYAKVS